MPILPLGLGKGLMDRLRNRLAPELGGGAGPTPGSTPGIGAPPGIGGDDLTPGEASRPGLDLLEKVVNRLTRNKGESRGPTRRPPPSGTGEVLARIQEAGRRRVLLMAHYAAKHGHGPSWRYLGPYELVPTSKEDPGVPLLFAWCAIHHAPGEKGVEAFTLRRFLDLQVTDHTWQPAWPIKVGGGY